ncbi:hypothetical protein GCM10010166_65920 [Couchioplanes caeruleus subsp. azureus]|nr:hypothetical protein GCM10010166_65920 [Couchioplanes caeruleus subsp. azureus]
MGNALSRRGVHAVKRTETVTCISLMVRGDDDTRRPNQRKKSIESRKNKMTMITGTKKGGPPARPHIDAGQRFSAGPVDPRTTSSGSNSSSSPSTSAPSI